MLENNFHIFILLLFFSMIVIYYLVNIFDVLLSILKNQKYFYSEVIKWKKKDYYNKNKKI